MKKIFLIFISVALTVVSVAQKNEPTIMNPIDFQKVLLESQDAILVDIRPEEQYEKSRLLNSIWAFDTVAMDSLTADLPKSKSIFLYCTEGKRTIFAGDWLMSKGFSNIYILKGGFENWKKLGFEIDKSKVN